MSFSNPNSGSDNVHSSTESSLPSESLSSESDSAPEIWDEAESTSSESDCDSSDRERTQLQYILCLFLSFFQLCFHISDRAISHLLVFFCSLFRHVSSHAKDARLLRSFSEAFPRTLHSLRKGLKFQNSHVKYVVCSRCHRLYTEESCLEGCKNGENPKCNHVEFPNTLTVHVGGSVE